MARLKINPEEGLTAQEIADAFPNECIDYIPRAIKVMEVKMLGIREKLQMIECYPICEKEKVLFRMFVEVDKPQRLVRMIKIYKSAHEIAKNMENQNYLDNIHKIATAKARPIETLVALEKQKMTTSRVHGCCPLGHTDSHPSFVIYRGTNTFHCFSCKKSGDSIAFYQLLTGVNFNEAVKSLSN